MTKKYIHFSFDNVIKNFIDITENGEIYKSVFENSFFNDLKYLHDTYGAVFTINCVNLAENFDISKITDVYKNEFSEASDWLKFAFHSKDVYSKYAEDVEDIAEQYKTFTDAILKIAGVESIDSVIRLGYYTGTLNNIKVLKNCKHGIKGFLTADDGREINYYLSKKAYQKLSDNNFWRDEENDLYAIPTQTRLEKVIDVNSEFDKLSKITGDRAVILELFTHEHAYDREKLIKYIKWAHENNYIFDFAENHLNEL